MKDRRPERLEIIGSIEVITGPMYSSKTSRLISEVSALQAVGHKIQVFNPDIDTRYGTGIIRSHNGPQ